MGRKAKCKVFISYSRHDEEVVRPLARLLAGVTADPVFLDIDSLKPGDLWDSEIETALRASAVFILCWCCQTEKSKNVKREIKGAVAAKGKRLIPVLFCSRPLPRALADRQWVDLRGRISHICDSEQHPGEMVQFPGATPVTVAPKSTRIIFASGELVLRAPARSAHRSLNWCSVVGGVVVVGFVLAGFFGLGFELVAHYSALLHYYHTSASSILQLLAFSLTMILIGICGVLLYRRWKRRREHEADEVAQTAREYFEQLGRQESNAP